MKGVVPFAARRTSAAHEDCKFWGLTPVECRAHHYRLADFHLRLALRFTAKATAHAEKAAKALGIAGWALVVLLASMIALKVAL